MYKDCEHLELLKRRIYDEYQTIIKRLITKGVDIDDAPDVASQVTITAVNKRDQLHDSDKLVPWLMKIADNEANAYFKAQTKLWEREISIIPDMEAGEEIDVYETIADEDAPVEEIVMTAIKSQMVWDLTSCLNKKEYMIFKLHNVEGYKLLEISEKYNINYDTVRSIHSRTCKKLKRRGEKLFRKEGII